MAADININNNNKNESIYNEWNTSNNRRGSDHEHH